MPVKALQSNPFRRVVRFDVHPGWRQLDRPAATPSPIVLRCAEFTPLIAELEQPLDGARVDMSALAVDNVAQPVEVAVLAQPEVHQDLVVWPAAVRQPADGEGQQLVIGAVDASGRQRRLQLGSSAPRSPTAIKAPSQKRACEPGCGSDGQRTLGVALPWAMAAAMVRPGTQVVSISADGGFLFSAQELETATRLGLSFTHVIMRDNSYDMVAFQEILKYGLTSGVKLGDYDGTQYAGAFGAKGIRVNSIDDFENAFKQSLGDDGITIVDVPVDYTRNSELFAQLHEGVFE
jgi:hypothetical protein